MKDDNGDDDKLTIRPDEVQVFLQYTDAGGFRFLQLAMLPTKN